jgi:hypothetical protein
LPFVVISRSSSEENYHVRSVQENNVGNLEKMLLGKLPRFERLAITLVPCSPTGSGRSELSLREIDRAADGDE